MMRLSLKDISNILMVNIVQFQLSGYLIETWDGSCDEIRKRLAHLDKRVEALLFK